MIGRSMKTKTAFLVVILFTTFFFIQGSVIAKAPQFRLDLDNLNLQKGVSANLVFSLTNAKGAKITEVNGLDHFDILTKSRGSSTQIINGDVTYQENTTYVIMPKETGTFTLQGKVEYEGKSYETNILKVNVSEGSEDTSGEAQDLFVKTHLSNDTIYFGQKVVLSYELYSRYNIENFGFTDDVNMKDFIGKDIPKDQLHANYTYINGKKYVKYEAKQTILSPIKTGTFTIPSYNFQVNVSTGDFFSSSKPMYLQTDAKELTVKPLPVDNQPADFSGVVGKLNIEANYDKQEVKYGDSLTLQVTASGDCNLDNLKKIIKDDIPGFTVYETQKDAEETIENNQYQTKKEFEVILVPEKNGELSIDPIHISYFDPELGSYKQAEIPGTTITVTGEVPQNQTGGSSENTKIETVKIDQVSYSPVEEGYITLRLNKSHLFVGFIVIVLLILITVIGWYLVVQRKKQDPHLKHIYKQIKNSHDQNQIYNLFNDMMKQRFGLSVKASSRAEIQNRLAGNIIVTPVMEIINYIEDKKNQKDRGETYLKEKIIEIYKNLK